LNKWIMNMLLVIFAGAFLVSAYFLIDYAISSQKQKDQFDELAQLMSQAQQTAPTKPVVTKPAPTDPVGTEETTEPTVDPNLVPVTDPETGETVYMLPEFTELYLRNNDLVGWIRIDDTKINYPVVQSPDRVDYYLHRDFYGKDSAHGCIYVREQCDVFKPSDNLTIYGHRMRDGSMFRALLNYQKQDFYENHKYIQFNTLTEHHTYEVVYVFRTTATSLGFFYHIFVDAENEADYNDFVGTCKALALYDTGIEAVYGDKLITLSTCEWSQEDGRLVVVAKRVN